MTEQDWLSSTFPEHMYFFLHDSTTNWKSRWLGWLGMQRYHVSERKWRLFVCACCYGILHVIPTEESRQIVVEAERYAEGMIGEDELNAAIAVSMESCERESRRRRELGLSWQRFEVEAINAVGRVHRTEAAGRFGTLRAAAEARAGAAAWQAFVHSTEGAEPPRPSAIPALVLDAQERLESMRLEELRVERARQAALLRDVVGNPFRSVTLKPTWQAWNDGCVVLIAQEIYSERAFDRMPILADALEDAGCDAADILAHCRGPGPHVRGCWVIDLLLGKQ